MTRAFLLLEDDDPVDWEVDRDGHERVYDEPAWAHAHRWPNGGFSPKASVSPLWSLRERRAPRRGGQAAPPPQVCLCPVATTPAGAQRPTRAPRSAPRTRDTGSQRGSRITTGSSRVAIDL
jgi:hypothetical protein